MNYGNIILIVTLIFGIIITIYIIFDKKKYDWDEFQLDQLEKFITSNVYVLNDYLFLSDKKQRCFYEKLTENTSYEEFQKILDIRMESKKQHDLEKIQYLNDSNEYQEFILKILKYISLCLGIPLDGDSVMQNINDKIYINKDDPKGSAELKAAVNTIAKDLVARGYTLNQFTYLDKFYVDPKNNQSNAQVIKDFVSFMKSINKWEPKNMSSTTTPQNV